MNISYIMTEVIPWVLPYAALLEYVLIFLGSEKEKSLKKRAPLGKLENVSIEQKSLVKSSTIQEETLSREVPQKEGKRRSASSRECRNRRKYPHKKSRNRKKSKSGCTTLMIGTKEVRNIKVDIQSVYKPQKR